MEPNPIQELDVKSAAGIEALLRAHQLRTKGMLQSRKDAKKLLAICDSLLMPRCMQFAVDGIANNLANSITNSTLFFDRVLIHEANCHISMIVVPRLNLVDIWSLMPGGYAAIVARYIAKLQWKPGFGIEPPKKFPHLAQWVYCTDAMQAEVRLTIIPEVENPEPGSRAVLFAEDLLRPDEKAALGL